VAGDPSHNTLGDVFLRQRILRWLLESAAVHHYGGKHRLVFLLVDLFLPLRRGHHLEGDDEGQADIVPRGTRSPSQTHTPEFPSRPLPDIPVGGRLSHFLPEWQDRVSDAWVIKIVREGLHLHFVDPPPLRSDPILFRTKESPQLEDVVNELLEKSAIELVPAPRDAGFYSRLFLVPKKGGGGWRPVIDLSALNKFLIIPHFKMETFRSIIHALQPNEWVCSIDLQDAYFHIAVHPRFRKFLRFTLSNRVYQFRAMPFGLATAPYLFTRLLRAVCSLIHFQSIKMHIYFDDSLIRAANPLLLNKRQLGY